MSNLLVAVGSLIAFAVTSGLGVHAFYRHKKEAVEAISARMWMYWLYSVAFLAAAVANFVQLWVTLAFGGRATVGFHIGYATSLLALSYLTILAGRQRTTHSQALSTKD